MTRITVDGDSISYKGTSYKLGAGESVECRILIGERRIIDYFIEPFGRSASMHFVRNRMFGGLSSIPDFLRVRTVQRKW